MINLFLDAGRIVFEINREALDAAKIRLDPTLLNLARSNSRASTKAIAAGRHLQFNPPPDYPKIVADLNLKGTVQLEVSVRKDGSVKNIVVKGGHPLLADALSKAVIHWKYTPASTDTTEIVKYEFTH